MFPARLTRIFLTTKPESAFNAALLLVLALCPLLSVADTVTTVKPVADEVIKPDCITGLRTERATIERITDGDTVVLADQRRVRLIGINAAEPNAQSIKLKIAAQRATEVLETWLPRGESVVLHIGDEPYDHHDRLLAHITRASDGLAVAHLMVQRGLAVQSAVAPTTRCVLDFVALENHAVAANLGLWKVRELMSISANKLNARSHGFKLISGTVTNVKSRKRHDELFVGKQLRVKVRRELAKQMSLQTLLGKNIEVRGWLSNNNNQTYLWLHHAANLSMLDN